MRIERRNTTSGKSPYAGIDFRLTTSEIKNPDGSVVFRLDNVEVPKDWSQVASDVLAQKYFRKAGVAARLKKVEEETVPSFLWRSVPDAEALALLPVSLVCLRQRNSGTPSSGTGLRFLGTPALRKYFWASTSAATWLQASGTSMSV